MIVEKVNPLLFFVRSLPKLLSCFLCSVQLFNLISRNFYCDAIQQYRYSNFSDMFCLNCIFVIDAAVKQLVSRSFLKYGASAVTIRLLPHTNFFLIKSNLHCTRIIKLAVAPKRGSEWRSPTPRLSARATQLRKKRRLRSQRWRAVGYTVSDLTGLGIEPQTSRTGSDFFNNSAVTGRFLTGMVT